MLDSPDPCNRRSDGLNDLAHVVPVKDFDAGDLLPSHIKDQHPLFGRYRHVPVIRAIGSLRSWLHVERGAKVVTTTATVNDPQTGNLSGKLRFVLFDEKLLKLMSQPRKHIREQRWFPRISIGYWFTCLRDLQRDWLSRKPPPSEQHHSHSEQYTPMLRHEIGHCLIVFRCECQWQHHSGPYPTK